MLLYLSGHSRPDIAFAVHQCACYTFKPTSRHFAALKRIGRGRYLKGTADKGLILRPSKHLHVDCFPDADFAGLYNHEDSQDPHVFAVVQAMSSLLPVALFFGKANYRPRLHYQPWKLSMLP
eukprot:scaffold84712_cov23-Cyclotella_meneghiniana.AAC.1